MTDAHIEKILEAYKSREEIDKFAHLASYEEIVENDYNLNIPRYVDTFEEEEVEPLTDIVGKINTTNQAIQNQTASLLEMLGQLHGTTPEADAELKKFLKEFEGWWGKELDTSIRFEIPAKLTGSLSTVVGWIKAKTEKGQISSFLFWYSER